MATELASLAEPSAGAGMSGAARAQSSIGAGIVLRDGNAFRFHATARPFFELDGTQFTTPGHARLAAARLSPARASAR